MKLICHSIVNSSSKVAFSLFAICIVTSLPHLASASSWFNFDDLALFDLIEEVNGTFYEFMSIQPNASLSDIKKSYRQLSLKFHPDKNPSPDASIKFRQLVAISDVLKDEEKRSKYDQILVNGLPDWKSGIYYLRKARKLGLLEMTVIVSLILTIGHYLCQMASYYEQLYTYSQLNRKKERKGNSKSAKGITESINSDTNSIPIDKPHIIWNSLPVKSVNFSIQLALLLVESLKQLLIHLKERREKQMEEEESEELDDAPRVKFIKQPRKLPEYSETVSEIIPVVYNSSSDQAAGSSEPVDASFKSTEWTNDELSHLVTLTKRFPVGTPERYERISEKLGRSVTEVVTTIKMLKSNQLKISNANSVATSTASVTMVNDAPSEWSQNEQKLLEEALQKFPRGTDERWEKISFAVPGKSKVCVCFLFFCFYFTLLLPPSSLFIDKSSPFYSSPVL